VNWIEYKFRNSQNEYVHPEQVISSTSQSHTLLMEWKEGENVSEDQAKRYLHVQADDLIQNAFLPPSACKSYDVVYIGLSNNGPRLLKGLQGCGAGFPLLLRESDGFRLAANEFAIQPLNMTFAPLLKLDFDLVPRVLLPFDHDSPPWLVASYVIPKIVEYMCKRETRVLLTRTASDVIPACWNSLSSDYQNQLKRKVHGVIKEASQYEFSDYLSLNKAARAVTHTVTWDITRNPMSLSMNKRTSDFKRLQRLQAELIEALRTGKRQPQTAKIDFN